jgi:hypothetical protein
MSELHTEEVVRQTKDAVLPMTRGPVDQTLAEEPSFINVREVQDWCKESREYKPPILSSMTLLTLSLGVLVGFVPALAATDIDENGAWWGVFLSGTILGGVGCACAVLAMVVELPSVQKRLKRKKRPTALERLADRMEGACEKGRLRAAAAQDALRRERDEKEHEQGIA